MRISDWSSDVCSSDLVEQQAGDDTVGNGHLVAAPAQPAAGHLQPIVNAGGTLGRRLGKSRVIGSEILGMDQPGEGVIGAAERGGGLPGKEGPELARPEIGSASCRDRECA